MGAIADTSLKPEDDQISVIPECISMVSRYTPARTNSRYIVQSCFWHRQLGLFGFIFTLFRGKEEVKNIFFL